LTYQDDVLNAFTGTLAVLQTSFGSEFHHGLPEMFFDLALLWQPTDGVSRRPCQNGRFVYPSWSWTGWVGGISYDLLETYSQSWMLRYTKLPLFFVSFTTIFSVNLDGSPRPICDIFYDISRTRSARQEPPPGWSRQSDNLRTFYTHPSAVNLKLNFPLPIRTHIPRPGATTPGHANSLLYFHTERVWLTLGESHPRCTPRLPLPNKAFSKARK